MVEFIKHAFGFCGEVYHPNILNILFGGASIYAPLNFVYVRFFKRKRKILDRKI